MKQAAAGRRDVDTALVFALSAFVSLLAFLIYFRRGEVLLYGDAVAHINIARKVFDSQTPGLLQLGTVWLPLPHLMMMPFLLSKWMWTTGIGGSIPSMIAYVFLVAGVFRLVRDALGRYGDASGTANSAAWLATAIVGLNPNLLYLQATAMTEIPYLAFFVWAVVYFAEFVNETLASESVISDGARSKLGRCAWCVAAAEWTRYDGWFLAGVIGVCAIAVLHRFRHLGGVKRAAAKLLIALCAPALLWLGYNATVYGNPLEFANGPYSAKAIERKTAEPGHPPHPGAQDPPMAALYFFKAAQMNMAEGGWERAWVLLLVLGSAVCAGSRRGLRPLVLLLTPLPFYMLSVAYSGVPVFVPPWWPFSYYNVRYGVQMLPAFAAMTAVVFLVVADFVKVRPGRIAVGACLLALVAGTYGIVWRRGPVCLREASVNSKARIALEKELAHNLRLLPENATFLMFLGNHVGALQEAEIELRRVVHEGNHRTWKRPADPEGLWEKALANPAAHVGYVISFDGDDVDRLVNRDRLTLKWVVNTPGQATARVWEARSF